MTALGRLSCVLLLFGTIPAAAADLVEVRPERVGMSAERLARITTLASRYVEEGKLAGVLTMVARSGKIVYFEAVGHRGVEDNRPLTKEALFRVYSMTKPVAAVAAMMLYEEGAFQLNDPVSKFVPELSDLTVWRDGAAVPASRVMTMQHLLTHTAGFSYGFSPDDPVDKQYRDAKLFESGDLDEFAARLSKLPLKFEPGTQWHYSVAVDITGLAVQRISGVPLDRFLKERLFTPLGMHDTFFDVPESKRDRLVPSHRWDAEVQKLVPFQETTYPRYRDTTFFSGGGGLVSTAMDYMRFAEMLRNGGSLGDARILSPKTVEFMTLNHLPASVAASGSGEQPAVNVTTFGRGGFGFGLGFGVVTDVAASAVIGSPGEYSWGGAAGTVFWVDPVEDIVVIGMIQLMGSPWPLRSELKVLTNQAITRLRRP